jgi:hypothetical protein
MAHPTGLTGLTRRRVGSCRHRRANLHVLLSSETLRLPKLLFQTKPSSWVDVEVCISIFGPIPVGIRLCGLGTGG